MGFISNRHTGFTPETRAEAERIAATRCRALAEILGASADAEAAGQAYWESERDSVTQHLTRAFEQLRSARGRLREATRADVAFEDDHRKSPKLLKALEIGMDHYDYKPDTFLARALMYDARLLMLIDALLEVESAVQAAASEGDLKRLYRLLSTNGRTLALTTAEFLTHIVRDSQTTQETSNVVEFLWETEGNPIAVPPVVSPSASR